MSRTSVDITGQRFGKLTAVKFSHMNERKMSVWLCKCDCGNTVTVPLGNLRSGNSKSCGCATQEHKAETLAKAENLTSQFESKYAVCPFYHRHDFNRICCEGTEKNNTVNLVFGDKNSLKRYAIRFCNSLAHYHDCLICKMLNSKYED